MLGSGTVSAGGFSYLGGGATSSNSEARALSYF